VRPPLRATYACTVWVLRAPAVLGSSLRRCAVSCAFALIVNMLRALRSVYSNSSQTGATSQPSYVCVHSVCLARASCITVLCESPPSCTRIRLDCHYAARPEVCGLKVIWDRWDLPTELDVYAQCVSCALQLHYGLCSINSHFKGYAHTLSLFTSPQGQHERLVRRAAARTKRIFQEKLWRVQYTLFRQLYCVLSTVLMCLCRFLQHLLVRPIFSFYNTCWCDSFFLQHLQFYQNPAD